MSEQRPTSHYFTSIAVSVGILFLLGAFVATMPHSTRLELILGAALYGLLGAVTLALTVTSRRSAGRVGELERELAEMRAADENLRSRMAVTLREPVATIVGFADKVAGTPTLPIPEQHEMLVAIRDNAREIDEVLSAMLPLDDPAETTTPVEGVVLVDEEVQSIASTIQTDAVFEAHLERSRAWGDSSQVRQVLRTLIRAAEQSGCAHIRLRTQQRSERAVVTISGRDELLTREGVAALTGNAQSSDSTADAYVALKAARQLAGDLGGSVGYAEAFGTSHIVLDLPAPPEDLGPQKPREPVPDDLEVPFGTIPELRPDPSAPSIRFS